MPSYVRVLGERWKVQRRRINDGTTRGLCDGLTRTITLDPVLSGREDLLHELLHAIEFSLNINLGEQEVQAVARSLWAISQDNPECPVCGHDSETA